MLVNRDFILSRNFIAASRTSDKVLKIASQKSEKIFKMNNPPSFTLEMGEFKFELNRKFVQEDDGRWVYLRVIKRTIGQDYYTRTERRHFNLEALFLNESPNRGGIPFQVETRYEDEDFDFDTNIDWNIGNFNQKWNDSPIVAALANLGLAEISRSHCGEEDSD